MTGDDDDDDVLDGYDDNVPTPLRTKAGVGLELSLLFAFRSPSLLFPLLSMQCDIYAVVFVHSEPEHTVV